MLRCHVHAPFVIYIHNVQFRILSRGMILPQKVTSNTFYSFPHGCGITLQKGMKCALHPLPICNLFVVPHT